MGPRVALVTGAGGGIGGEVASRLARDGHAVALNCHPRDGSEKAARAVADLIIQRGGRALVVPADVSDAGQVASMATTVRDGLGPISALVCNAAVSVAAQQDWRALSAQSWSDVLAVNVVGTFLCVRAVYDQLLASGCGAVVVMSSVAPLFGRTGNLHYVTSKAALVGFTRALAREIGPTGIRVNAVAPGAIRTPAEEAYGDAEELARSMAAVQSLHRRGEPGDVAGAVGYLLGPDAAFVTGQLLVVNGGWVMH